MTQQIFGVDPYITHGDIVEVVLGDNLVRDDVQWEAHVFVAVHWGAEAEVADVENSKASVHQGLRWCC
jgi:hypothetical protein